MKTAMTCFLVWATAATAAVADGTTPAGRGAAVRAHDFGKQWVRTHPFTLMGLTRLAQTFDPQEYQGAGLRTVLSWEQSLEIPLAASRAGLPWHYHTDHYPSLEEIAARFEDYTRQAPGCEGVLVWDEPRQTQMLQVGRAVRWFREKHPDLLVYSNALPNGATGEDYYGGDLKGRPYGYGQYVRDFIRIIKPDVFMFDIYPFRRGGTSGSYFQALETVRSAALQANIPYWVFIQSYEGDGHVHFPSESELRMQMFSSLAYGFTGMAYFTYDVAFDRGLLDPDGEPNELYHHAAVVNAEVANLGRSLRFLTSRNVFFLPGQSLESNKTVTHSAPPGTTPWKPGEKRIWMIKDIQIEEKGKGNDGLIGCFGDDEGGKYFLLVNLSHGRGTSAQERAVTFVIRFTPDVDAVTRLSRHTGKPEQVSLTDGVLRVGLPGGTGDLFKLNSPDFPGYKDRTSYIE